MQYQYPPRFTDFEDSEVFASREFEATDKSMGVNDVRRLEQHLLRRNTEEDT